MNIASFLVVAIDAEGNERRTFVDAQTLYVQFEDLADGEWTFRVHAYFEGGKVSNASDPLTVGINIPRDQLGVGLGNIMPDLRYVLEFGNESMDRFHGLLEGLASATSLATVTLKDETDQGKAMILEERTARVEADQAIAVHMDAVQAELEGELEGQATALSLLSADVARQGDEITATAEVLEGVSARAADATAEGLSRLQVTAGTGGATARFAQVLRVTQGAVYSDAGFYMDVRTDGVATAGFDVQRFFLTDSTNKANPFRFENGTLFADAFFVKTANISGLLKADQIEANSIDARELKINGVATDSLAFGAHTAVANGSGSGSLSQGGEVLLVRVWINMSHPGTISAMAAGEATTSLSSNLDQDRWGSSNFKIDINGIAGINRNVAAGSHYIDLYGVGRGNNASHTFAGQLLVIGSKKT